MQYSALITPIALNALLLAERTGMILTPDRAKSWAKVALKLGIATTGATVMIQVLQLGSPFPAAIVPVLVMGQTRGSTIQASLMRIKGTLIGIVVGTIVHLGLGTSAVSLFLAVSLSTFLSYWAGLGGVKGAAGYIAAITLVLSQSSQPWLLAISQFAALSIGIVITNLVDELLWAPQATVSLRQDVNQLLQTLGALYQVVFDCYLLGIYREGTIATLNRQIIMLVRHSEEFWPEAIAQQQSFLLAATWEALLIRTWDHIKAMDQAVRAGYATDTLWQEMKGELTTLAEATIVGFHQIAQGAKDPVSENPSIDLGAGLLTAAQKFEILRATHGRFSAAEQRRFASFFYSMEEVAKNLEQMSTGL
jgi:hypothetical protein